MAHVASTHAAPDAPDAPPAGSPAATAAWLALANFAIGLGAFVVIGLLPPIAEALAVTPARAGWVMTAYAAVYAVGSPVGVALTGRFGRRTVLVAGLAVFALGALAAAAAPGLWTLLAARAAMALGAGLVTPVAASVAVALASPEARGRTLATVFGGLTLAQAVGVPAGAWLGYALGWRTAFVAVAALTAAVALVLSARLPRNVTVPATGLRDLADSLRSPVERRAVAFTVLFLGAIYVLYTYLGALLTQQHGAGRDAVTLVLAVFGIGAVAGNAIGGRLADRIGPRATLRALAVSQLVLLPALTLVPMPLPAFMALVAVWSVCGWAFMVPQQARLAALSPTRVPVLFALNASAIYVGGAVGSLLGAGALGLGGLAALGPVAVLPAALALASLGRQAR